ncbi:MAG: hypothetical protein HC886_06800 [Leptolyngbyaceae cyanobacterium SM1_1_3]|nr:hypothetical protein [Leptolyngbyaceae cyanobacterium SM1_1_3]NJN01924.1 hypothetical protein [Leptolyngbyaceae cyanobacterium RM1_1_2]NJO10247.1 hypothetical protein [Leptolyngbyaceae cyanobacterium SL_1_1]
MSLLFGISKPGLANPDGVLEAITLSPNFTPNPVQQNGVSGGAKAAATVVNTAQTPTGPCNGFISEQPDHVLRLNAFFQDLEIQVASQRDTTLVIQGTGGTWCNDDASDHNPRIAGQWQAGTYNVWVGSFRQEEYYPYRLIIRQTD